MQFNLNDLAVVKVIDGRMLPPIAYLIWRSIQFKHTFNKHRLRFSMLVIKSRMGYNNVCLNREGFVDRRDFI